MTDQRMLWRVGVPGCGGYSTEGFAGAPRRCGSPVAYAGLRLGGEPLEAWLAFSCTLHHGELIAARELLDRDRAILEDWAARERRALDGKGWDHPRPLAVGVAARELVRRAWVSRG